MCKRRAVALFLITTLFALPLFAQSRPGDDELLAGIRKEENDNSQIMKTMHMLTDIYGPRLTGSPNHEAAAEWAIKQMSAWAYVKQHFGSFEDPRPGFEKFAGYFNIDSGTGRVRGASVFGPPEGAAIMREILKPFKEDGVVGAAPSRSRNLGGSDNTSFSNAGLPGIGLGQDPIEYQSNTWHTNLDTYERILEGDVKKDAVTVAWCVYQLSMRDDLLPRFTKANMPPRPPAEPASSTTTTTTTTAAKPSVKALRRGNRK